MSFKDVFGAISNIYDESFLRKGDGQLFRKDIHHKC